MAMFKRFFREKSGNVAPIFAIAAIPLLAATGAAVDYSNAFDQRSAVQDALDSAALAGGKKLGTSTTEQIRTEVDAFYRANLANRFANPPEYTMTVTGGTIRLQTTLVVSTYFLGLVGVDTITFDIASEATAGSERLEVVMVLDNSGSMSGTKISTLRTAASDLADTLYALGENSTKTEPVKVGIVPFAGSVNVGSGYSSASWLDTGAHNPYHGDSMKTVSTTQTVNNLSLFTALGRTWGGCVEERPSPYDVTDETPTTSGSPTTEEAKTLFVPFFAPDEPDNWTCSTSSCNYYPTGGGRWGGGGGGGSSSTGYSGAPTGSQSYNNYLRDSGGACGIASGTSAYYTGGSYTGEQTAFERTCKYTGGSVSSITVGGLSGGPNFGCTTAAVTPLTTTKATVTSAITSMGASGSTNITGGLMWGWRLLSPTEPFTEGRAYAETDNKKFLILMTDGENTYYPNSKFLKSWYGAWGYIFKNHLGTTSTSESTIVGKMNEKLASACTNVKAAGITVYTVAFQVSDDDTLELLEDCATEPDMAFQSSSTSDLAAAFQAIGEDISSLRVSH